MLRREKRFLLFGGPGGLLHGPQEMPSHLIPSWASVPVREACTALRRGGWGRGDMGVQRLPLHASPVPTLAGWTAHAPCASQTLLPLSPFMPLSSVWPLEPTQPF